MNEQNISTKAPEQIRKWTCHKIECYADYIGAYAETLRGNDCCYLELFAGFGRYTCKGSDCNMEGSVLRAVKTRTKFAKYIFITRNHQDEENLKRLLTPFHNNYDIELLAGTLISEKFIRQLFDLIPRSVSIFAFIDPPGYRRMRWATIKKITTHGSDWRGNKMELLICFPLEMALLRNLTRPECEASITRLYGNRKWQEIKQAKIDGSMGLTEVRKRLVELFKEGLKGLGYRYVEDFEPTRFSVPPLYHVISASDSGSRIKLLEGCLGQAKVPAL